MWQKIQQTICLLLSCYFKLCYWVKAQNAERWRQTDGRTDTVNYRNSFALKILVTEGKSLISSYYFLLRTYNFRQGSFPDSKGFSWPQRGVVQGEIPKCYENGIISIIKGQRESLPNIYFPVWFPITPLASKDTKDFFGASSPDVWPYVCRQSGHKKRKSVHSTWEITSYLYYWSRGKTYI